MSRYKPMLRRRREGKTNYHKREKLIRSGKPLLVVRVGSSNITVQLVKPEMGGDKTLVSTSSKELERFGWKGSPKCTPAAYLLGLLTGIKAKEKGVEEAILYTGVKPFVKGSRIAGVVKGLLDSGFKVPCSEEVLPSEDRIRGEHIASYASSLKREEYERRFSGLLRKGLKPEDYPSHFEAIRSRILEGVRR